MFVLKAIVIRFKAPCFLRIIVIQKKALVIRRMCLPSHGATESMELPRKQ